MLREKLDAIWATQPTAALAPGVIETLGRDRATGPDFPSLVTVLSHHARMAMKLLGMGMPDALGTSNLLSGRITPIGIYVVSHRQPVHAVPHESLLVIPTMLPKCHRKRRAYVR